MRHLFVVFLILNFWEKQQLVARVVFKEASFYVPKRGYVLVC